MVPKDGDSPVMEVMAASDHWAICAWQDGAGAHESVLALRGLRRITVQQQAQPQPTPPPGA